MTLRLPYGFARQHHLLVTGEDDDAVRVAVTAATAPAALAELRRHADRPLLPELVSADELARRLAERAAQSDVTARDVADDIGQDEDIARLPELAVPLHRVHDGEQERGDAAPARASR